MTNRTNYQTPVDKLLSFGNLHKAGNQWHDYIAELGLDSQHIPDLIAMAVDGELYGEDSDNLNDNLKRWAPVHAWWALAQLHAEAAIESLIELFHEREDCDLVSEEMPKVFGKFGVAAIPSLQTYLADSSHGLFPRITASNSLEEIGKQHPTTRSQSIQVLTQQLKLFDQNPAELNGFIVASLTHLQAKESTLVIKSALLAQRVPEDIAGTWDEIQQVLGVTEDDLQLLEVNSEDEQQISVTDTTSAQSDNDLSPIVEVTTEQLHSLGKVSSENIEKVEDVASEQQQSKEEQVNIAQVNIAQVNPALSDSTSSVEDVSLEDMEKIEAKIPQQDLSSPVEATTEELNTVEEVILEDEVISQDVEKVSESTPKQQSEEEQLSTVDTTLELSDPTSSVEDASLEDMEKIEAKIPQQDVSSPVEATTEELNTVEEVISKNEVTSQGVETVSELTPEQKRSEEEQLSTVDTTLELSDPTSSVEDASLEDMEKIEAKIPQQDVSSPVEATTEELNTVEEVISKNEVTSQDVETVSELTSEQQQSEKQQVSMADANPALSDPTLSVKNVSLDNVEKVEDITEKAEEIQVKPEVLHSPEFKLAVEALSTEKKSSQGFGKASGSESKSKKRKKKKK